MQVAIPSMGRPTDVKSQKVITSAVVYVPEVEVEAYERSGVRQVVGVPMDVRGITRTRNWILDKVEKEGGSRVVFVDDDVKNHGYIDLLTFKAKHRKMKELQWLEAWKKLFDVAEGFGVRLWGTSTDSAPRGVYPYKPFIMKTYVTASCCGLWASGPARLRFDESYPVKEDYELCLRCIRDDGGVLGARFLYWENNHWVKDGGCKNYRTQEIESDCIRRLIRAYPGMIRRVTKGGSGFSVELSF